MDYESTRSRAAATIQKNGKLCAVVVSGATNYDPVAGTATIGDDTEYEAYAVEIEISQFERSGSIIQAKDRKFIVAGLSKDGAALVVPNSGNKLKIGTTSLEIYQVIPLSPGSTNVIYTVYCRG